MLIRTIDVVWAITIHHTFDEEEGCVEYVREETSRQSQTIEHIGILAQGLLHQALLNLRGGLVYCQHMLRSAPDTGQRNI